MRNILEYGAGIGQTPRDNQRSIQCAIDEASERGGGTVIVPAGRFETGSLRLKSNVTLHLEAGAALVGSRDWRDYPFSETGFPWVSMSGIPNAGKNAHLSGFIWAEGAENICIEGKGTINGQGGNHAFPCAEDPYLRRPMLVLFLHCKNIRIYDVTMQEPAFFNFYAVRSRRIWIRGVYIDSLRTENGDGLDFDGTEEVMISDCDIKAGDDAISLKSTMPGFPNRDYMITNCRLSSIWAGFRMGTESTADMRDILMTNCVFDHCNDGLKIQDCSNGIYENIRISNCIMRDVHRPVFMTANSYRLSANDDSIRPKLGGIHDVVIEGITAYMCHGGTDYQRNEFVVSGTTKDALENITIRNCSFVLDGGGTMTDAARLDVPEYLDYSFLYADVFSINGVLPSAGPYLRHVHGLRIENCTFMLRKEDARKVFYAEDVDGFFRDVRVEGVSGGALFSCDSSIHCESCSENSGAFSVSYPAGRELELLRKSQRETAETDKCFGLWAAEIDDAEKCTGRSIVSGDRWEKLDGVWRLRLTGKAETWLILHLFGNMSLFVNGHKIGECRVPKLYENVIWRAFRIGDSLQEGENIVEICWDEPSQQGGINCLLPFGEFRPYTAGLVREAILAH